MLERITENFNNVEDNQKQHGIVLCFIVYRKPNGLKVYFSEVCLTIVWLSRDYEIKLEAQAPLVIKLIFLADGSLNPTCVFYIHLAICTPF